MLGLVLALFAYQLSAASPTPNFIGFVKVEWKNTKGCKEGAIPPELPAATATIGTWDIRGNRATDSCLSEPIPILSEMFEIEYAADTAASGILHSFGEVLLTRSGDHLRFNTDETLDSGTAGEKTWKTYRFVLQKQTPGTTMQLRIINQQQTPQNGWLSVRNRINFYTPFSWFERLQLFLNKPFSKGLCAFLLAVFFTIYGKNIITKPYQLISYAAVIAFFAFPICFRSGVFFHWDEWHVLQRFAELGPKGIIYMHNEHFLPLFFGFYYAESALFRDHYQYYIVVSIFLHVLNVLLLTSLLRRFSAGSPVREPASRLLAMMYMLNSLHSEVLHWAFLQSILLAQIATFLALLGGWDFVVTGRIRSFLISIGATFMAPFLFGNGFITPLQLGLVVLLGAFVSPPVENSFPSLEEFQQRWKRIWTLLIPVGILTFTAFYIYSRHSTTSPTIALDHPLPLLTYIFVGSEFGTILRGLGLFPILSLDGASKLLSFDPSGGKMIQPELLFAIAGLLLSFAFPLFGRGLGPRALDQNQESTQDRKSFRLWLLGQLLIASSFVLPSLVRWQLGLQQSLALRYQYSALVGLCILLLPAFLYFLERMPLTSTARSRLPRSSSEVLIRTLSLPAQCALIFYFSVHFWEALKFDYFTGAAVKNKIFIAELRDWNQRLASEAELQPKSQRASPTAIIPYNGAGTTLADLYPILPASLTPGKHPNEIYGVVNWLSPGRYPLP